MTDDGTMPTTDLIRWTFAVPEAAVGAVQTHLEDLGAEVFIRGGGNLHVLWEETDADLDAAVEAIWSLAGTQFEITQEEFQRLEIQILHPETEDALDDEAEFHPEVEPLDIREL